MLIGPKDMVASQEAQRNLRDGTSQLINGDQWKPFGMEGTASMHQR